MYSFLALVSTSVIIGLGFLLLSISAIILSKKYQYFKILTWIVLFNILIFNKSFRIIKMF